MSYLIAAMVAIAILHLLFEAIIAPSIRMKLHFELFSLRDDLRMLKAARDPALSDRQFDWLQESLNGLIAVLHRFDGATLVAVERELRHSPLLRAQVDARARVVDGCASRRARHPCTQRTDRHYSARRQQRRMVDLRDPATIARGGILEDQAADRLNPDPVRELPGPSS